MHKSGHFYFALTPGSEGEGGLSVGLREVVVGRLTERVLSAMMRVEWYVAARRESTACETRAVQVGGRWG